MGFAKELQVCLQHWKLVRRYAQVLGIRVCTVRGERIWSLQTLVDFCFGDGRIG